ncbi:MAG: hypothetical protein HZA91_00670, partial [Verrucomicrobia bacterium]|nr:hypothetical protein [Verrucomicrobiota bacterium]
MRTARLPLLIALLAVVAPGLPAASTPKTGLAALLDGVHEIAAPGVPGTLCVFGDAAFPVVIGGAGRGGWGTVASAAQFGNGRVVALSHNGYFGAEALEFADTGRFIANAARWAAGERKPATGKIHVGLYRKGQLEEFFDKNGFKAGDTDLRRLNAVHVLVADAHSFSEKDVEPVTKFVRDGGGLITASCGWGWAQLNAGKDLRTDFSGNKLIAPMGMVWGDGTLERTTSRG